MVLPVIETPWFTTTLPLSKTEITFRSYTVGDEKILLQAEASRKDNAKFYVDNTLKVLRNVVKNHPNIDQLPSIDVEYLLLQLRAKSVGEIIPVTIEIDGTKHQVDLDLEQIKLEVDPARQYRIALTDKVGVEMVDITFANKMQYNQKFKQDDSVSVLYESLIDSVKSVYDENRIYVVGVDCTKEDIRQFLYNLSGVNAKLYEFISTMPKLYIEVKLKDGTIKKIYSTEIDFLA